MDEYIKRESAIEAIMSDPPDAHYQSWYAEKIKAIPAAYVAPVRHGRWVQVIVHVEFEDGFVDRVEECCSACHEPNGRRCTYFCPNCGAKMDGELNE